MAKLARHDLEEIIKWFENTLNQLQKIDRRSKMKMRKKIRDEVQYLITWSNPTPAIIAKRLEEKLKDVFKVMPFGLKDDLPRMLAQMLKK